MDRRERKELRNMREELRVLRMFWDVYYNQTGTVECPCGMSAYEDDDFRLIEVASDIVAEFYEGRASV